VASLVGINSADQCLPAVTAAACCVIVTPACDCTSAHQPGHKMLDVFCSFHACHLMPRVVDVYIPMRQVSPSKMPPSMVPCVIFGSKTNTSPCNSSIINLVSPSWNSPPLLCMSPKHTSHVISNHFVNCSCRMCHADGVVCWLQSRS
jgi:hypothetical protein